MTAMTDHTNATATREARFIELLEEHKGILYRVAMNWSRNDDALRDLVQEMIMNLWSAFPGYDEGLRFSTWMYRVALNVAISSARSSSRPGRSFVSLEETEIQRLESQETPGDADETRHLQRLISELDDMNRALILLYIEGYTASEIGEILGISATNATTRISRVRTRLQDKLALQPLTAKRS